jgi:hypothetical protein
MYSPRKADTLLVNIGNAVCVRLRRLSDLPVSIFCSLPVLSATLSYAMRTSSLTVFVLIVLTVANLCWPTLEGKLGGEKMADTPRGALKANIALTWRSVGELHAITTQHETGNVSFGRG